MLQQGFKPLPQPFMLCLLMAMGTPSVAAQSVPLDLDSAEPISISLLCSGGTLSRTDELSYAFALALSDLSQASLSSLNTALSAGTAELVVEIDGDNKAVGDSSQGDFAGTGKLVVDNSAGGRATKRLLAQFRFDDFGTQRTTLGAPTLPLTAGGTKTKTPPLRSSDTLTLNVSGSGEATCEPPDGGAPNHFLGVKVVSATLSF